MLIIKEIEELIENNGLSDELFEEFKLSLKRVPKVLRCQHCYITAYNLRTRNVNTNQRRKNHEDAIRLIEYGIENHTENDFYKRAAYEHMGMAYGDAGEYEKAKIALQTAFSVIPDKDKSHYIPYFAYLIVRMEVHCSKFTFTPYLQELYEQMLMADSFEADRRTNIFYRSLVEIILSKKNNDKFAKKAACEKALSALDVKKLTALDRIFIRHKAFNLNIANITNEALDFLKKNLV